MPRPMQRTVVGKVVSGWWRICYLFAIHQTARSSKPDMRIRRDFAVLSQKGTLKEARRRDQQLVDWIAMERLRQLGWFHHDVRMKVQKGHAWFSKGALYPKPDCPIELQSSVLHEFGDFPTRDDADAKDAVNAKFEKLRGAWLAADPAEKPTRPKYGCPAESLQGIPVLAGNRLQRLTELENRISKTSAPGRRWSCGFRDYQHFNRLAGFEWKAF
jgi:hypothetical protein